ncbi:hypothetical protein PF005_g29460 [Phytophthora fragariae]|uniref:Uncharacterized protein n=1 Tax=Phytophthora fragariae TaxID=53985 RepID=A0A6A3VR23_9STRA|nr:hypothetical protein PF003_g25562 [Phytophthora fragariae]KAE8919845.1 hypothetical protein PF009_g29856 [Phytophthora fragariae]KAE8972084.1 hypothetical protein PF011_g25779 [Phytophthora fragariae]KAE9063884.1 hypothetical protein PF007_g29394 [Phytophthora fragariae]KAE9074374.1 hypothetical protein PF006_g28558 [Phytophthora fragariae]
MTSCAVVVVCTGTSSFGCPLRTCVLRHGSCDRLGASSSLKPHERLNWFQGVC